MDDKASRGSARACHLQGFSPGLLTQKIRLAPPLIRHAPGFPFFWFFNACTPIPWQAAS